MSVTIRLSKIGKRNAPAFRIVVANTRDKRNGKPLEVLGHYNPSHNPTLFDIDKKKFEEWKSKGALVTKAVVELVEGTYEFKPYTRQNEVDEEAEAAKAAEAKEKEAEEAAEEKPEESEEATPEA